MGVEYMSFQIARDVVLSTIAKGKPFDLATIAQRIKSKGGIMRVAANYSVLDYLKDFVEDGVLEHKDGMYTISGEAK